MEAFQFHESQCADDWNEVMLDVILVGLEGAVLDRRLDKFKPSRQVSFHGQAGQFPRHTGRVVQLAKLFLDLLLRRAINHASLSFAVGSEAKADRADPSAIAAR